MNSFRVMNTRFRILKGGKIGLAFSIALIGGMLILSSIKANATDYFTGTSTVLSNLTSGSVTVETATNTKTNGTNTDTKGTTSSDDVIFAPTSWANSYYIVPSTVSDYYGTGLNAYSLNQNPEYLKLDLTFASGANANNITKQGALIYTAPIAPAFVPVSSSSTYSLTPTPSSIDYTANLIFQGNNTVSGYTGIGDGNIKVNGSNVVFNGIVTAGSIDVSTTGTSTFNSNVNITSLNMTGAGTAILNSNLTGNVIATGDNQGILTTTGANQTITGNIGSSTSLDLGILNIGSDTVSTNYSKTTINGDVFANSTVLNNNGTTNSSELIMESGKNITSTITTADANMGILTLAGGTQTVTGQVGTNANKLAEVNAGNGTTNFTNDVYATNLDVEGTGTVNLNGNYTGTALRYNEDGIVNLADAKNIDSAITSDAPNQGTLNLAGTSTVTGQVGDATNKLKEINANGIAGKTVTFANDVYATNTNIGAGTVNIKGNLTGAVNSISTGTGTLTTTGIIDQIITGTVGNIGNLNVSNTGFTTTVAGDVNAVNTKIDSTLIMTDGSNVTSTIAGTGNLTLDGNSTVTGTVGNLTTSLGSINANGASDKTVTFANDVYATNTNIGAGTVDLKGNLVGTVTPKVAGTGILKTSGTKDQTITGTVGNIGNLNVSNTGFTTTVAGDVNAVNTKIDSTLIMTDGSNVTSTITGAGNLTLNGDSTVTGTVGNSITSLGNINAGTTGKTVIFANDVYATNTNIGAGTVILNSNLTGNVVATGDNQGILTTTGSNQTIIGNIGSSTSLDLNTLNIGSDTVLGNYSTTTINGNIFATSTVLNNNNNDNGDLTTNSSELILASGKNITSTITTADANMGILTLAGGTQTVTGTVGAGNSLANVKSGADSSNSTFVNDVYANTVENTGTGNTTFQDNVVATNVNVNAGTSTFQDNLNATTTTISTGTGNFNTVSGTTTSNLQFTDNGIANLNNGLTGNVATTSNNKGTLNLVGNNTQTVSGTVGDSTHKLAEVNAGNGTTNFANDVYATNTKIGTGTINFNTVSGTTNTNIIFTDNGTANLLNGLTGDIDFSGKNATVNVSDGKGILGSIQTLALNNTGIINYQGDGTLSGNIIGSGASGIKELNINTNGQQSGGTGLVIGYTALARELYADVINLKNNATLTLKDNTNLINTGSDNILITVDNTNTGTLTFEGTSNIKGEVGQSNNVLNTINAGATGGTVTFDDMVYASTLKYSDNGKVVLNGDNSSNASSEGMIGTIDFNNEVAATLAIGDDVNLTVGSAGTQFINGNDAILEFAGSSIITGILGGNTAGSSTFKEIHAGADGKTVTFKNDVYVKESTFHVSGEGAVNFQGNLIGSLIYDDDGVVNVSDGKNIVVSSSVPVAVTTATTDTGSLNFLGTTLLATDIGTSAKRLKNVTFGLAGSSSSSYTQNLDKDIYAKNTYIGNGTNQTILEMNDDITFGGSLTVRANSALDVSTRDIKVTDNLALESNSLTRFKIYTDDITASGSSVGAPSGSITTDTLTIDDNAIIKVNYIGTLYGAGSYNLISANGITGTYYGTEANGKVSDNSIIDSIIKVDGNNLILFADRTGGGKYGVEDLYIEKSGIGEHYSNGASQALAGYAYDTLVREGALGNIVTRIEELDGGLYLSSEKKAQMVEIQKLLAPVANNSSIQSSLTASTLVSSTIKDRMSDMRFSSSTDFIPYSGYSSGTYTLNNSLWIKAMGSKATQSKVEDYDGYNSTTLGFVAGMDRTLRSGSTIGLALAHANTKINQTDFRSGDSADTQSIQFSTYGSMDFDDTYVDGILSYARHDTDSTRTANSGKLSSSSTADQISAKVEVGHRVYFEDVATLTPFVSVEYGNLNQKGYTEKGTAYQNDALKVDSVKVNKGTLGAGAKLSTNLNIGDTVIVPEFKLAAYNAFGDTNADIKAQYVGGGNQFVTPTQDLNKTMFNAGLGVKTTLSESTSLMIGVDYDRSKDGNFQGYSGNVSFRLNF